MRKHEKSCWILGPSFRQTHIWAGWWNWCWWAFLHIIHGSHKNTIWGVKQQQFYSLRMSADSNPLLRSLLAGDLKKWTMANWRSASDSLRKHTTQKTSETRARFHCSWGPPPHCALPLEITPPCAKSASWEMKTAKYSPRYRESLWSKANPPRTIQGSSSTAFQTQKWPDFPPDAPRRRPAAQIRAFGSCAVCQKSCTTKRMVETCWKPN